MELKNLKVSVVCIGKFAPKRGLLESLVTGEAITKSDAEQSSYTMLVDGQVVQLALPWASLALLTNRCSIETSESPYVRIADLATKLLAEIQPESEIEALGINLTAAYTYRDWKERDQLGTRLMPPTNWGPWGELVADSLKYADDDVVRHGGLVHAQLRQPIPEGRDSGWIEVQVLPGAASPGDYEAIVIVNDHYGPPIGIGPGLVPHSLVHPKEPKKPARVATAEFISIIESQFDKSIERSRGIAQSIVMGKSNA